MTIKPKTITVQTPSWVIPGTHPKTEKIVVTQVTKIHGIKHYYCRPSWSCFHGWFVDQT